ncbi:MAG: S41 family peptidase [Flavobacteriaceae bacterium]|nr:S41 family peptidase [Flavobacteriaceae bacterium]
MKKLKKIGIVLLLVVTVSISLSYKSDFFEVAKQIEIYTTLFKELNMYYIDETNPAELTDTAIKNMLKDLDPYTVYYDEQGVQNARINAAGEYGGIGAVSTYIEGKLIIVEPHEDSPADKAGLKAGDQILKVNDVLVTDTKNDAASSLLKGLPNTKVKLQIKRQQTTFDVELTREKVVINPVPYYKMLNDEVGYISFIKFNQKASSEVKNAFEDLKELGMKKLILDIRGNLGGLVNEAVEIVNFFIPKDEVVVTTKAKVKKWSDTYKTRKLPIDLEIPIVVLIDDRSASASEILAGALQDLDRAVIMGERSFGKGLVQRYRKLTYGTQLKLTISKYYTPSGRSIQELDYSSRDENGNIPKFSDRTRNPFKTRNGRTVYDGGGIQPDIKFEKPERSNATEALLKSQAIFDFATHYYYTNPTVAEPKEFTISNDDYQDFISFLRAGKTSFKTSTESYFDTAMQKAESEAYKDAITQNYAALLSKLNSEKIDKLSINKGEIQQKLQDEIIKRYYHKKGEYINKVHHDKAITNAIEVLNDAAKYDGILK